MIMQITDDEYKKLIDTQKRMTALENGGVDNWEFYGESYQNTFNLTNAWVTYACYLMKVGWQQQITCTLREDQVTSMYMTLCLIFMRTPQKTPYVPWP
jgi:hypothetical protein